MNQENLIFYKIMNYNLPKNKQWFSFVELSLDKNIFEKKIEKNIKQINDEISYEKITQETSTLINICEKYWTLYRSLPFVETIYICNSISFNSCSENSDIDLFIVCKKWRLWICRFFSWFLFVIFWLKRSLKDKKNKFCLSFYISEDKLNLFDISLKPFDIYLIYWIAHLVPIYEKENWNSEKFFQKNRWIYNYLPNLRIWQNIYIWNKLFLWNSWFKNFVEKIMWFSFVWNLFEKLIKSFWLPILIYKTKRLWTKWRWIIIKDTMLKFHWSDIRKKINLKYFFYQKK